MTAKNDILEEALEIIKVIDNKKLMNILSDLLLVCDALEVDQDCSTPEVYAELKMETAYLISEFAETYGDSLNQVRIMYKDFYKKVDALKGVADV